MTDEGQRKIWKLHRDEIREVSPPKLHRELREKYHPKDHPEGIRRVSKRSENRPTTLILIDLRQG